MLQGEAINPRNPLNMHLLSAKGRADEEAKAFERKMLEENLQKDKIPDFARFLTLYQRLREVIQNFLGMEASSSTISESRNLVFGLRNIIKDWNRCWPWKNDLAKFSRTLHNVTSLVEKRELEEVQKKILQSCDEISEICNTSSHLTIISDNPETQAAHKEINVICRICEEKISALALEDHTQKCFAVGQSNLKIQSYDDQLTTACSKLEKRILSLEKDRVEFQLEEDPFEKEEIFLDLKNYIINVLDMPSDEQGRNLAILSSRIGRKLGRYQNVTMQDIKAMYLHVNDILKLKQGELGKKTDTLDLFNAQYLEQETKNSAIYMLPQISIDHLAYSPSIRDFTLLKHLNRGSFGRVFLAKKNATGDYYSIKVINKNLMAKKNLVEHVNNEWNILASIDSPFVVKLFYSFQTIDYLYMVMEYLNGGDVHSLLQTIGKFSESCAKDYIAEVVCAIELIHGLGIVHRDIKPDNILIAQTGHIKLVDFGLARSETDLKDTDRSADHQKQYSIKKVDHISDIFGNAFCDVANHSNRKRLHSLVGTIDYMAPEIILGTGHDQSVDWWALGVMLYQFLTGKLPFYNEDTQVTFENILTRNITWPDTMSYLAKSLIEDLLTVDPEKRLGSRGSNDVKKHPFFDGIDWNNLISHVPSFIPLVESMEDTRYFEEHEKNSSNTFFDSAENDERLAKTKSTSSDELETFVNFTYTNVSGLKDANEQALKSSQNNLTLGSEEISAVLTAKASNNNALIRANEMHERALHCLIVEDNPVTLRIVKAMLKQLGIISDCVDNGKDAVDLAMKLKYDIIFMDIMMPTMDGLESTRHIRESKGLSKDSLIVAFTAMCHHEQDFSVAGFNDFLSKPFTKDDLFAIVKRWVHKQKRRA